MKNSVLKRLWAVAREYGIDSDALHQLVFAEYAIEHISALTDREAYCIIDRIQGKKAVRPTPFGMITPRQKEYIKSLADALGWEEQKRINGFVRKYYRVENVDWLTSLQASKVIEALKGIAGRRQEIES